MSWFSRLRAPLEVAREIRASVLDGQVVPVVSVAIVVRCFVVRIYVI